MNLQVLLGSLIGDASITKTKRGYYVYSIEHSEAQKSYLNWKSEQLKIYNLYPRERLDKRSGKTFRSIVLSKTSNEFKIFYEIFYTKKFAKTLKKEITIDILKELTPEGIAVWYCDDGNAYYNSNNCHITLATNGFSDNTRRDIIKWFKEKYGINFKITTQGAIRLTSKKECEQFMLIIEKYIPSCMSYKTLENEISRYYYEKTKQRSKTKKVCVR